MKNIQALGILRFSYAAKGGFQVNHDSVEERLEYLFAPVRIEERFMLFEHVTLPAIKAQTDPNFTLVIVTSQAIPEVYLERLLSLVDGIPQIAVVLKGPLKHRMAMRRVARPYKDEDADVIAHFRLDDDDAIAIDFIERTKAGFEKCQVAYETHGRCALDFNQGYELMIGDGRCTAQKMEMRTATAGLVAYIPQSEPQTIMNYPHHRLHEHMPVVTDVTPDMFVRSFNTFNDSPWSRGRTVPDKRILKKDIATLKKRFKISIPDILKIIQE
ncbi:hypothetical protein F9L33_06300 [Amylibacter sp. SFDW26]|uniref:glycosyltransferase n=1 Tax=Amylibacter sp. SFDW26 TaxID=2652722 RepID=UPI0012626EED|nr:glycosyltransferase [Amylibacter sp. SFDW26]KAB7614253.1 hypothetical protein F9L33_06300 [Amylibacter sp. SFDW26]